MIASLSSWALNYLLHGIIIGAVAIAVRNFPSSAQQRCVLMRIALFAPFLTATAAVAFGRGSFAVVPFASIAREDVSVEEYHMRGAPVVRKEHTTGSPGVDAALAIVIAAIASSAAGAMAAGRARVKAHRALAGRVRWDTTHGLAFVHVRLSRSERSLIPVALRGREICVSNEFQHLALEEQKSVMLHEYAHVERRDPEWLDASRVVAMVFWWQPLNRVIVRLLERDTELAADHVALASGASARALVSALSHFAGLLDASPASGAALLRDESPLLERARLILSESGGRPNGNLTPMLIVGALAAGLVFAPRVTASPGFGRPSLHTEIVQERHTVLR